jgi:HK97 family phage major capsid protein
VASSQIKALLDELTSVLAEMGALEDVVPEGEQMSEDSVKQMETLSERAAKIKERVEFHKRMDARQAELRSIIDRGAPASKPANDTASTGDGETNASKQPERRSIPAVPKAHGRLKHFQGPNAEERALRAGMHLRGYVFGDAEARRWCIEHEVRAQSGSVNELGGVLVAPEFANEVIRLLEDYGVFPREAKRRKMTSDQMFMPRRVGGLSAIPIGENDTPTESQIVYNQVEMVAKLWGVGNRTPNSLIEDSPISLAEELAFETAYAFAVAFDDAGFIGDGSPAYHGTVGIVSAITNVASNKGIVTAGTSRNTFDTLTMPDFTSMLARLPVYARRNAKWYISPAGWAAAMARLSVTLSGNAKGDAATAMPETFLGYPVVQVVSMLGDLTGTANKIACVFGDLSQAASFGDRRAVALKTSTDRYMEYDQTFTFATTRASMVCHDVGSSTKAGPVVALKFAA